MSWLRNELWSAWSVLGAVFIVYLAQRIISAIYALYFDLLSKFPGPRFAAVSYIPYAFHLVNGTFTTWVKELHERYDSEVVRLAPHDISFITPSAWKHICGGIGQRPFEKDDAVYGKPPNGVDTLLTAPKPDHSRMRRVLDHAFSVRALRQQEPTVLTSVDKLIRCFHQQINGEAKGKVDLTNWYSWMSFDLIGDLAFGESFNCLDQSGNHPWVQMVFGNLQGIVFLNACSRFPIFASLLPYLIPKGIKKMMDDHWDSTQAMLSKRIAKGTTRPDFVTPILENNSSKGGLTQAEMEANASLFIIAGSDSIATSLTGLAWYLLQEPELMQKVRDEVDGAFHEDGEITIQGVDGLLYLCAVVQELFRIYPVALAGQAHIVPPEGATIAGYPIPGNTGVSMNQFAVYRSPNNFTDPDDFAPSRWLGDPHFAADRQDAFHPFSLGARNCIGKNLGLGTTRLVLAKMVWHFDMELGEETDKNWLDQKSFIVWQKKPLFVKLTSRQR